MFTCMSSCIALTVPTEIGYHLLPRSKRPVPLMLIEIVAVRGPTAKHSEDRSSLTKSLSSLECHHSNVLPSNG